MKLRHIALALGLFAAFAAPAAAQDCQQWTIKDTPPLDRIQIGPLSDVNGKGVKFAGSATLYLDDETELLLEVKRKLRKKPNTYKFKLKTGKRVDPKVRVTTEIGIDPEKVIKLKLLLKYKGEKALKQKDPTKIMVGECPSKSTSFTVGTAGGSFDAADGKVSFFFPKNSVTEDTEITVTPVAPPAGTDFVNGAIYQFEPDMAFLQPVDLTISYDEAAISVDENDLRLAKFIEGGDPQNGNHRVWAHSNVDTTNNRVTGFITGFSRTGVMGPFPPRTPNLVADVNTDRTVTLDWTATNGHLVILERVKMSNLRAPTEAHWAGSNGYSVTLSSTHLTWTDHGPAGSAGPGLYYYRISATNGRLQSAPSAAVRVAVFQAVAAPPDPESVSASAWGGGIVLVQWEYVVEADYYQVERKEAGQGDHQFRIIAWPTSTEYYHMDTDAAPATDYVYRVVAYNTSGWSPGQVRDTVTTSDAEFTVDLSAYRLIIAPGESVEIDISMTWLIDEFDAMMVRQWYDVTFSAATDSTRVTAEWLTPPVTENGALLEVSIAEGAPCGLTSILQITFDDGSGTLIDIPEVTVIVQEPEASVNLSLTSIDPAVVAAGMPTELMLYGSGFSSGAEVHVWSPGVGTRVVGTYFVDQTELFALVPPLAAGTHEVKVVNPDGAETDTLELFAD